MKQITPYSFTEIHEGFRAYRLAINVLDLTDSPLLLITLGDELEPMRGTGTTFKDEKKQM